jgi:hypothetical protein
MLPGRTSVGEEDSNDSGGMDGTVLLVLAFAPCPEECDPCRCRPSIWSGSGEGMWAKGPSSDC